MITYGIDAHLLLRAKKDGVPRYAECLLKAMMTIPLEADERVVLYGHAAKPAELNLPTGWSWKVLRWPIPRGWTHGRLSLEMMFAAPTVLFIPGHEVPAFVSKKTAVVTTLHDIAFKVVPDVYEPTVRRRQDLAVRRALSRAKTILSPSNATKKDLIREYRVDAKRIVVTPLAATMPVVHEDAGDVLRSMRVGNGQYILSVSRLEKKKNTLLLVRAFAALKRKLGHGHPLTLVLAGNFGYGEAEIRRAIAEEQIESEIRLPGYLSDHDVSLLMRHALCFAFPSRAEGFGLPILEAMEHGAPVIASNVPSSVEVSGDAALLISQNDVAACSRAIESLLTNSVLCERYIAAGHDRAKQFSWAQCAKQTFEALRAAIR